jgi:hypothetical protein
VQPTDWILQNSLTYLAVWTEEHSTHTGLQQFRSFSVCMPAYKCERGHNALLWIRMFGITMRSAHEQHVHRFMIIVDMIILT